MNGIQSHGISLSPCVMSSPTSRLDIISDENVNGIDRIRLLKLQTKIFKESKSPRIAKSGSKTGSSPVTPLISIANMLSEDSAELPPAPHLCDTVDEAVFFHSVERITGRKLPIKWSEIFDSITRRYRT
jgi:hypothetical protein